MYGEKVNPAGFPAAEGNKFSLDNMDLDRRDVGASDAYDPFYKGNVTIHIALMYLLENGPGVASANEHYEQAQHATQRYVDP